MGIPASDPATAEPFEQVHAKVADMLCFLKSEQAGEMTHSDLEREIEEQGRELLRRMFQGHLDLRSPGTVTEPVYDAQGTQREPTRPHERTLGSVFGPVTVSRVGYGAEGSASLHPLDGELNLPPERYSHELRRRAAVEVAKGSYEEALEAVASHSGTQVSKRQLEELAKRAAKDFDAFYEQRSAGADTAQDSLMILSVDGKGVVMHKKDLRKATREKAEAASKRTLGNPLSKGKKRNAKRNATVATVYTIAPFMRTPEQVARILAPMHAAPKRKRPRPQNKRVWASLEKSPKEVITQAFEEALQRDPGREKRWFALVDGAPSPLKILPRLAKSYGVELTVVLDLIHVSEYLWKASTVFHDQESRERKEWVRHRLTEILRGHSSRVAGGIRRSATLRGLDVEEREAADKCCKYLLNHTPYLRYDQYLARGSPIATGVIEGACRHLVKDRMELTGARWRLEGAEAVLRLRALRSSGDFDEYWRFHEAREYERNHAVNYANHQVPSTRKTLPQEQKSHLRIVK